MDTGQMDLLFSHASETTVCLESRAPIMRRKRSRALRRPQTRDERNEKGPARDEMDTGQMDLLFSHASETTVCLERRAPIMRRKRSRALRGPQTRHERNAKGPFRFLIARKKLLKWVVKNSDPYSDGQCKG
ncbi:hypothetical protein TNCV_806441 [Trichonephila clavipes]|nr:hypothetical protein TNCV_806441 [Trichonephila clavipes]